jgi:hypothetical protein
MSEAKVTTDHETIRRWAEARGGRPRSVEGTGKKDDPGLLRFDFGLSLPNSTPPILHFCIRTRQRMDR